MTKISSFQKNKISFKDPINILKENQCLESVNKYAYLTPEMELKSTEIDLKYLSLKKSTLLKVAKKTIVIATLALAMGTVLAASLFASAYTFPLLFGIGLLCYKLYPCVIHPLEKNYHRATLYRKNLEGIADHHKKLKQKSKTELKKQFLSLGINIKHYKIKQEDTKYLSENDAISLLLPLLARFNFWKEQILQTEKVQTELSDRIEEIKERINQDDHYSLSEEEAQSLEKTTQQLLDHLNTQAKTSINDQTLEEIKAKITDLEKKRKLSSHEKTKLVKELVSLTYKIDDLDEDDSLSFQINSRLLSSIKASYALDLMHNLTQQKMIQEFGYFNSQLKHVRQALKDTPTGDDYFRTHGNTHILLSDIKDNLKNFDYMRHLFFHQQSPHLENQQLA